MVCVCVYDGIVQTKTPPRLSHKQLLEMAGVVGGPGGGSGRNSQESSPPHSLVGRESGTWGRNEPEASPPPMPHHGHSPHASLDLQRQAHLQQLYQQQEQQRLQQHQQQMQERYTEHQQPLQAHHAQRPQHAQHPHHGATATTYMGGAGMQGGTDRAPLPPPARHGPPPTNPPDERLLAGNDPNLLNLEIYRAVAAANQEPMRKPVTNEDSWNSVDSDRQLALRLQTEEVMQHSMSQDWSQMSQHSVMSEHSSRSLGSVCMYIYAYVMYACVCVRMCVRVCVRVCVHSPDFQK